MLKRHRCEISLRHNEIRIETYDGVEIVKFLPEHDIPKGVTVEEIEGGDSISLFPRPACSARIVALSDSNDNHDKHRKNCSDSRAKVEHLMGLGFNQEQCCNALIQANGDVDMAASLLMSNSI